MLPLCASPARREGATRFYQAFYHWTRLTTRDHAYSPPPRRYITAQQRRGAHSSVETTVSEDQAQGAPTASKARPLNDNRRSIPVDSDYYATLTANNSELLRKVSQFSKIGFKAERKTTTDKSYIIIWGTRQAVKVAADYIESLKHHLSGNLPDLPDISQPNITFHGVGVPDKGVKKRARDLYHNAFDTDNPVRTRTRHYVLTRNEIPHVQALDEKALSVIRLSAQLQQLDLERDPVHANRPYLTLIGPKDGVEKAVNIVKNVLKEERDTAVTSDFRSSMRAVSNPVAVITTGTVKIQGDWDNISELRGMTVSSFTPVTLSPVPVISFNIRTPSRTLEALDQSGHVIVHILASNTEGATIANAFTKPYDNPAEPFRNLHFMDRDISVYPTTNNPPKIAGPGVLTRLACKLILDKRLKIGDHVIVFAQVLAVAHEKAHVQKGDAEELPTNTQFTSSNTTTALAYAHGKYRGVGKTFEPLPATAPTRSLEEGTGDSISAAAGYASEVTTDVEPATASDTETATKPATEPVTEPVTGPMTGPVGEPVGEPVTEPATEPETEPATEPMTELTTDPATAATTFQPMPTIPYDTQTRHYSTLRPSPIKGTTSPNQRRTFTSTPSTSNKNDNGNDDNPNSNPNPSSLKILNTPISDFLYEPTGRSEEMHLRLKQKALLESALEKLEAAKQSGEMADDDIFIARQFQIMRLRQDVIEDELDEGNWREWVEWMGEAFGEEGKGEGKE